MNKEQIVKALEVCANYQNFGDCYKCPAREVCGVEDNFLEKEALALIRELMADNERITLENKGMEYGAKYAAQTLRELTVIKMQSEIESRCVKKGIYPRVVERVVDEVAKEMLEDLNDAE